MTSFDRSGRKLRRLRRRLCSTASDSNPSEWWEFDGMFETLCDWAANMPWVVESSDQIEGVLRVFVIDCDLLSCHEPWFAVNELNGEAEVGPGLFVVLPDSLLRRGLAEEWAVGQERIGGNRCLSAVELPMCPAELVALQQMLFVSYSSGFESTW